MNKIKWSLLGLLVGASLQAAKDITIVNKTGRPIEVGYGGIDGITKRESIRDEVTKIQNALPLEQSFLDITDLSKIAFIIQGKNPNNKSEWTDYTLYVYGYVGPKGQPGQLPLSGGYKRMDYLTQRVRPVDLSNVTFTITDTHYGLQ